MKRLIYELYQRALKTGTYTITAEYFMHMLEQFAKEEKSAQQSVQRTAFAVGMLAFVAGLFIGAYVFGGR